MKCLHCQVETNNPKFCSRSCAAKSTNQTPKRKRFRKCAHEDCDSLTRNHRSSLCQLHWDESQKKKLELDGITVGEYRNRNSLKRLQSSSLNVHIRQFCRSKLKHLLDYPCFNCGYDKHVELCHIKPVSSFPDTALITEVNDPENVMPLCPNCHWEMDHNLAPDLPQKWRDRHDSNVH